MQLEFNFALILMLISLFLLIISILLNKIDECCISKGNLHPSYFCFILYF